MIAGWPGAGQLLLRLGLILSECRVLTCEIGVGLSLALVKNFGFHVLGGTPKIPFLVSQTNPSTSLFLARSLFF